MKTLQAKLLMPRLCLWIDIPMFAFLWFPEIGLERGARVTSQIGLLWDVMLTGHECCLLGRLQLLLLSPTLTTHGQALGKL